jgi:hypothetical protein
MPKPMEVTLESDSDKEEMKEVTEMKEVKESAKTKSFRKKSVKFVHGMETPDSPETDKPMKMYIKLKQMSLFPSIY